MPPVSSCPAITRVAMSVLAITLFVPLSARGQDSVEVQTYFDSVSRLYEALECERALEQRASAKQLTRGVADDVTLALYKGILLADMSRAGEARVAFKAAPLLNPEAKLSVQLAPKVEQLFEGQRQQVTQEFEAIGANHEAERQHLEAQQQQVEVKQQEAAQGREQDAMETASLPLASAQRQQVEEKSQQGTPTEGNVPRRSNLRSRALAPAIAGGVLLVVGGVSWGLAKEEQSRMRGADPSLASYADVQRSMTRGQSFQTLGFGLVGAGLVGLGLAAGFYVLGTPEAAISLGVGTDGTSAFVYGRWP